MPTKNWAIIAQNNKLPYWEFPIIKLDKYDLKIKDNVARQKNIANTNIIIENNNCDASIFDLLCC